MEDERVVGEITDLINRVYATAEAGLWVDGAARTTTTEIGEMIAADQIALARVDGQIVGSIRIQQLDDGVGEFGMLVADPAHRGKRVGSELIRFAEELSRWRGLTVMQLELLVPRGWSHPTKEYLHAWYTRIGYRPVRTGRRRDVPAPRAVAGNPVRFRRYHKPLIALRRKGVSCSSQ